MTIGVGVVGLGFMGLRYARFLSRMHGVRLVAVCDREPKRLAAAAAEFRATAFDDHEGLARAGDVDWVVICTPEDAHVEPTLAALASQKAVLIEKPVAHSLAAARAITQAAERAGQLVMVGHLLRFEPRWVATKRAIDGGDLGEISTISTRRIGSVRDQEVLKGRTSLPLYYGVHELDVARWFAGSEVVRLYAERRRGTLQALGFDVEDAYSAVLRFASGTVATVELGWHVPSAVRSGSLSGFAVVGTSGMVRVDQAALGIELWSGTERRTFTDQTFWPEPYGLPGGALATELAHFIECLRHDEHPTVTLADAVEALRLALALETSADRGAPVDLAEVT
jgi:UDP-N-acetylglucosamine 3-dehydrogenase